MIARFMTQGIVDVLEAVQIHEQHGQGFLLALRLRDCMLQALIEQRAVGKAGQAVEIGKKLYAFLRLLALAKLSDLHPDRMRHIDQHLIRLADVVAEEFDYANYFLSGEYRKGKHRMQAA